MPVEAGIFEFWGGCFVLLVVVVIAFIFLYPVFTEMRGPIRNASDEEKLKRMNEMVSLWIDTCVKERQLEVCESVIEEFIENRFKGKGMDKEVRNISSELQLKIQIKKTNLLYG